MAFRYMYVAIFPFASLPAPNSFLGGLDKNAFDAHVATNQKDHNEKIMFSPPMVDYE